MQIYEEDLIKEQLDQVFNHDSLEWTKLVGEFMRTALAPPLKYFTKPIELSNVHKQVDIGGDKIYMANYKDIGKTERQAEESLEYAKTQGA